jgi:hypothetical protein
MGGVWKASPSDDATQYGIPLKLMACGSSVGLLPSCTIGNAGAISVLATALNATYAPGLYAYFSQGALNTTPGQPGYTAGFYATVMSGVSAGTVYADMLDITNPVWPAVLTPLTGAVGIGAYTQVTSKLNIFSKLITGGLLSDNAEVSLYYLMSVPNNTNAKTFSINLNNNAILNINRTVVVLESSSVRFANHGVDNRQIANRGNTPDNTSQTSGTFSTTQVDTSVDWTLTLALQLSIATDYLIIERSSMTLFN